jgi:FG-GAP repeat protein
MARRACTELRTTGRGGRAALLPILACVSAPSIAQTPLWTASASAPASAFGDPLGEWPDVDGDGKQDVVLGEPLFAIPSGGAVGRVAILSGSSGATLVSISGALGSGSSFGLVLGPAADVTADGIPELFVGAGGVNQAQVLTTAAVVLQTYPGRTCISPGDFDGDGQADVVVGHPFWSSPLGFYQGQVSVYSGLSSSVLFTDIGAFNSEQRGFGLAPMGSHPWGACAAFVSAAMGGWSTASFPSTLTAFCASSGTPQWLVLNPVGGVGLGYAMSNVGDVDGDGWDDFLVGAPFDANVWAGQVSDDAGRAFLISGGSGATLLVMIGPLPSRYLGRSVGRIDDLDGDGVPDLLVGASAVTPWLDDVFSPYPMPYLGRAYVFSGDGGGLLQMLEESPPGEGFGSGVAGLGDIDGDEFPDFAVSEPYKGTATPGTVSAFSGRPAGVAVFGQGCAGSGGLVPRISAWPGPAVGSTVAVHVSRALGGISGLLVFGTSSTTWLGVPLPINLGALGMPTCSLAVSPDLALGLVLAGSGAGAGKATVSLAVPADPTLVGSQVFVQGYVVDPGPSALPGVVTRGLQFTVQP